MSLPYENTSSGERAMTELSKLLSRFGCQRFGTMIDNSEGVLIVQFAYREREVMVKASMKGYAAAWLKEHPYTYRTKATKVQHEAKAMEVARLAVYSIARDWVKGQITAIETGMLTFEGAFLGQILLPNGRTVLEHATSANLLAAPA